MNTKNKKIVENVSTIEVKNASIDLNEFYNSASVKIGKEFSELLKKVTKDGKESQVEITQEIIYQTEIVKSMNTPEVVEGISEIFIILDSKSGCLEVRKRLAILAVLLQKQATEGFDGLKTNGEKAVVAWIQLPQGKGNIFVKRIEGNTVWMCSVEILSNPKLSLEDSKKTETKDEAINDLEAKYFPRRARFWTRKAVA